MAGIIENEMINCFQQMTELQTKMQHLEEEKNNKAAEEVVKKQEVEPNLGIMSNWLDEYGEIIDEVERERVIVEQYNELKRDRHRGSRGQSGIQEKIMKYERIIEIEELSEGEQKWRELRDFLRVYREDHNGRRIEPNLLPQLRLKYQPTQEEYEFYNNREMIKERYMSLQKNQNSDQKYIDNVKARTTLLNNSPTFVSRDNKPTYFMKQYIESTHNMFLIQQKKINELEKKIEEMSPNLLNEEIQCDAEDPRRLYNNYITCSK